LSIIACCFAACGARTSLEYDLARLAGDSGDPDAVSEGGRAGGLCPLSPPALGSACTLQAIPESCTRTPEGVVPLEPMPCGSLFNSPYVYSCAYPSDAGAGLTAFCNIDCVWQEDAVFAAGPSCKQTICVDPDFLAFPFEECVEGNGALCCTCDNRPTQHLSVCAPCGSTSGYLKDCP
jgi:hypothetical protein